MQIPPLTLAIGAFVAIWVLVGGGPPTGTFPFALLALSGSLMLGYAVINGGGEAWHALPPLVRWLAIFCLAMPALQLVPLPPGVWRALPDRTLAAAMLDAAGDPQAWRPITMSVTDTSRTLLLFVWLFGLLLALMQLPTREFRRIFMVLLALGVLNLLIGIGQVVTHGAAFRFYHTTHADFLIGLFANKNHTGLFIALTLLAGYAALYGEKGWHRERFAVVLPLVLVAFAALIATFSRAGVLFGVVAVSFLGLLSWEGRMNRGARYAALAVLALVAVMAIIVSTDLASRALGRFAAVGADPRWRTWQQSIPLIAANMPTGGGIGSFPTLYGVAERLGWVQTTFTNHAHNEYIEQLIEVGVAAPILWVLTIAALAGPVRDAWRSRTHASGRLAVIGAAMVLLCLVHSAFDYPLRRPAIAVTFVVALAALVRVGRRRGARGEATGLSSSPFEQDDDAALRAA